MAQEHDEQGEEFSVREGGRKGNTPRNHRTVWTAEEDAQLARCIRTMLSVQETARLLGRTENAVLTRAGQRRMHFRPQVGLRNRTPRTGEETTT